MAAHWVLGRWDSFTAFNVHLPLDLTEALSVGFTADAVSRILVAWGLKGRVDLVKVEQLLSRGLGQELRSSDPKANAHSSSQTDTDPVWDEPSGVCQEDQSQARQGSARQGRSRGWGAQSGTGVCSTREGTFGLALEIVEKRRLNY